MPKPHAAHRCCCRTCCGLLVQGACGRRQALGRLAAGRNTASAVGVLHRAGPQPATSGLAACCGSHFVCPGTRQHNPAASGHGHAAAAAICPAAPGEQGVEGEAAGCKGMSQWDGLHSQCTSVRKLDLGPSASCRRAVGRCMSLLVKCNCASKCFAHVTKKAWEKMTWRLVNCCCCPALWCTGARYSSRAG
jgi:hypothetical protein